MSERSAGRYQVRVADMASWLGSFGLAVDVPLDSPKFSFGPMDFLWASQEVIRLLQRGQGCYDQRWRPFSFLCI